MAENVTLAPLANLSNDGTAIATINANNTLIEDAFVDCLSLVGNQPNSLQSNLDMNNFNIVNLPAPSTINSPVRVTDLNTFSGGGSIVINPLPTGGAAHAILDKNSSTNYDASWTLTPSGLTSIGATSSTVVTSNITGTAVLSGSSSGTSILEASAIASGTLTLPATTDTLVGKATTDILTNKTLDTAGTGNVIKFGGVASSTSTGTGAVTLATSPTITTPAIIGVTSGAPAAAGTVGEHVSSFILPGGAVTVPLANSGVAFNLTSMSLPAGDWDLQAIVYISPLVGACVFDNMLISLSSISATQNTITGYFSGVQGLVGTAFNVAAVFPSANGANFAVATIPSARVGIGGTIAYYLVVTPTFTGGTSLAVYGGFRGRRMH